MRKEVTVLLLFGMLLISPLVLAEEQIQTYSGVERVVDNVKMAFSGGDNKVELALEIREKEVDAAINNVQNNEEEDALKNLERAEKKLQIVQEKVSLDTSEEIRISVGKVTDKINTNPALPEIFDDYLLEEQKTGLTAVLTEKTYEYCEALAKEDFALMLKEEECNPDTAIPGLEDELKDLKDLQYRMFVQLMLEIRSCIDDPGTCNCEANTDIEEQAKCEKMVALAVKCEYKEDETSCEELEAMKPSPGDGFARSFVPSFLMNLFAEKYTMIEYGIQPSDGVPEECWDYNDKPECRQYDQLKETKEDWDEYGNYRPILYPGKHPSMGGIDETMPTMQESVPECFDEEGNFLEEKCGKITAVRNEEGLVNYIVGKDVDDIVEEFENKSDQHLMEIRAGWMMVDNKWVVDKGQMNNENWTMDGNGTVPMEIRAGWMMENNEWIVDPGYREMKQEMDQIQNQIVNMTYAPGTGPGGKGGWVIEGNGSVGDAGWVIEGDGSVGKAEWVVEGDKKVMVGGEGGKSGVVVEGGVEVKTDDGDSGSNNVDDGVDPGPQGIVDNQGYGDSETGDTHEVVEGDGGEGDYAEGTSADGDCGDGIVC